MRNKISEVYTLYGMELLEEKKEYMVFAHKTGYFQNVEILYFDKSFNSEALSLAGQYEELSYSVRAVFFKSLEDTQSKLFSGFFNIENSKLRMKKDYDLFCDTQTKKTEIETYEYVQPKYAVNNEMYADGIAEMIENQLFSDGPQLIILEAAAGFGKTCAAYELLNKLANSDEPIVPIFIELSKNRAASVFRYVLLDEIDAKFSNLQSTLVQNEIIAGRIPLIIDGFDELIGKSHSIDVKKAETMLETITELFKNSSQAKIILTSRKSAIFVGEKFKKWAEENMANTRITRIRVEEPTLKNWLGYDKIEFLNQVGEFYTCIKNPILLAYLRALPMERFKEVCSNIEDLSDAYFELLLTREKTRQSLQLERAEQLEIMVKLAADFIQYDISAEEPSFIRSLLKDIVEDDVEEYLGRYYDVETRPDVDAFCIKLSAHVLLDRISPLKNEVGFINDFVFGSFISDAIIKNPDIVSELSETHTAIMCTAISTRSSEVRARIFELIKERVLMFSIERQLSVDFSLLKTISQNYHGVFISEISISDEIFLEGEFQFSNMIFHSCSFDKCTLATKSFENCTFINCRFFEVIVIKNHTAEINLTFTNCVGQEEFEKSANENTIQDSDDINYIVYILRKFWSKRYSKGRVHQHELSKGVSRLQEKSYNEALESLRKDGYLSLDGELWCINKERMKEIKTLLGRDNA